MAGITRATFYRHVQSKGITVGKDNDGNPKVDVSELLRVYGDKIKLPNKEEELNTSDTPKIKQPIQHYTPTAKQFEIEVLKERITNLEAEKVNLAEEREREREQLSEQIDTLKEHLLSSQEQQKRLTLMITDQRQKEEGRAVQETDRRLQELSKLLEDQIRDRQIQDEKLNSLEHRIANLKEKGNRMLKSINAKNKKLEKENKELQGEVDRGFWARVFG
ncbi:MAG: hypothetical protein AAF696_38590 [Bacteroidota bacterium]